MLEAPTKSDDGVKHPGPPQDPNDFLWLLTEEPHRSRRAAIMKAHPEVSTIRFRVLYRSTGVRNLNLTYSWVS